MNELYINSFVWQVFDGRARGGDVERGAVKTAVNRNGATQNPRYPEKNSTKIK